MTVGVSSSNINVMFQTPMGCTTVIALFYGT